MYIYIYICIYTQKPARLRAARKQPSTTQKPHPLRPWRLGAPGTPSSMSARRSKQLMYCMSYGSASGSQGFQHGMICRALSSTQNISSQAQEHYHLC